MLKQIILALSLVCFAMANVNAQPKPAHAKPETSSITGFWSACIDLGPVQVPISISLSQNPQGNLTGHFYCTDQGLTDVILEELSFENGLLSFEVKTLHANFRGTLNGAELSGRFTQSKIPFPVIFKRTTGVPAPLNRPQEPMAPFPYQVEEVSYESKEANAILSGTLTLPDSTGPFPAVLLIAGSGPNDRNETLFGHKPFLVLADHLTRCGIAVLRSDKRGVGKSTGDYEMATTQDFAEDVLAGVRFLKSRPEINSTHIGLVGHSEGGLVAPIVAAKSSEVAFIVLIGGPGVTGEEILYEQAALIERSMGMSEELIARESKLSREMFAIVTKEHEPLTAEAQLKDLIAAYLTNLPEILKNEVTEKFNEQEYSFHTQAAIDQINTPWFRYFLTYDPATSIKKVKVPVLAIIGELDLQVAPHQNLPPIARALEEGGNTDFTLLELPKHNHMLQVCKTGSLAEYAEIEETMSPIALKIMSDWIQSKTQK